MRNAGQQMRVHTEATVAGQKTGKCENVEAASASPLEGSERLHHTLRDEGRR